jgi:hypothetical protein
MSIGSRIAIGLVALVCAFGFFITALNPVGLRGGAIVFYGMAGLCIIIAIACFFPKSHPVTLRLIGAVIFCTYASYVYDALQNRADLRLASAGFIFWGIPSGYLAVMGKYPSWGKGSAGFNAKQHKNSRK